MARKAQPASIVRSSAAEYLTFVAATGSQESSVEMRYEDENIWLTQKMMAALYDVTVSAINQHLKRIFADGELVEAAVIKHYLTTASDGKSYRTLHYSLQAIIAVGFKIENDRAVQFRKWANQIVKDYTIQGWTMDVERLKKGHLFTDAYFERQQALIREIRLSEHSKSTALFKTVCLKAISTACSNWRGRTGLIHHDGEQQRCPSSTNAQNRWQTTMTPRRTPFASAIQPPQSDP